MKIYEFDRRMNAHGTHYLVRTREITPLDAVTARVAHAQGEAVEHGRDPRDAAIGKLCEMVAVLITRLPPELADEALDYAYDIEE